MLTEILLNQLFRVRRAGPGWQACCPAHDDRNPSLSIREGERGLLIRCWAGCSLEEICAAIGLRVSDLFFDERRDPVWIEAGRYQRHERERIRTAEFRRPDIFREAEGVLEPAKGISVSSLTPDELDIAIDIVADAHLVLLEERDEQFS